MRGTFLQNIPCQLLKGATAGSLLGLVSVAAMGAAYQQPPARVDLKTASHEVKHYDPPTEGACESQMLAYAAAVQEYQDAVQEADDAYSAWFTCEMLNNRGSESVTPYPAYSILSQDSN